MISVKIFMVLQVNKLTQQTLNVTQQTEEYSPLPSVYTGFLISTSVVTLLETLRLAYTVQRYNHIFFQLQYSKGDLEYFLGVKEAYLVQLLCLVTFSDRPLSVFLFEFIRAYPIMWNRYLLTFADIYNQTCCQVVDINSWHCVELMITTMPTFDINKSNC